MGLFLLGMIVLTDGLKALAGDSLRGFLARFTGGRLSALGSGAAITALVQSSSATTLTTIGFVSAGLLTFEQSLGIVLGANLGTTSTGWLVALLGLKFSVGSVALPVIGVGALTRLLSKGRLANLGFAAAGFGLIFVGIDTLQLGMEALATQLHPSSFPAPTLGGRLLLVLLGAVMTVVMQSSSAAVATTLTALHSGTIDLTQAAALVIGQNVGTTITAGIGSIGANAAAKRTALAHVLFNLLTGLLAYALLPSIVWGLERTNLWLGVGSPALLLAEFHTAFNLLGVALFLPTLGPFARFVTRLIPERGPVLTRHLGRLVVQGPLAIDAAGLTVRETLEETLKVLRGVLSGGQATPAPALVERLEGVDAAIGQTREFLAQVRSEPGMGTHHARHLGLLHALDHLERLSEACREKTFLGQVRDQEEVQQALAALEGALALGLEAIEGDVPLPRGVIGEASRGIAELRKRGRAKLLMAAAEGALTPAKGAKILETLRWVDRLAFHVWRATHHLFHSDPTSIPDAVLPPDPAAAAEAGEAQAPAAGEDPGA
ncbi:MAG: Na/Pi cotransporter family protein, partial [Planctomycetes bacterium]|nr:Na/Pi cotransporter family protein [Planctomycetota bacterium]